MRSTSPSTELPALARPNVMGFANFSSEPNAAIHSDRWFGRSPAHSELSNVLVQATEDVEEGTEIRVNYDVGGGEERSFREHLERLGVTSAELDDAAALPSSPFPVVPVPVPFSSLSRLKMSDRSAETSVDMAATSSTTHCDLGRPNAAYPIMRPERL